jgi:hypothetical protein
MLTFGVADGLPSQGYGEPGGYSESVREQAAGRREQCAARPDIGGLFSAKGAFLMLAWGIAPGVVEPKRPVSAESAVHFRCQLGHHWRHAPIAQ